MVIGLIFLGAVGYFVYRHFTQSESVSGGSIGGYGGTIDIPTTTPGPGPAEQKILTYTLGATTRTVSKPSNKLVSVHPKGVIELRTRLSDAKNLTTLGVSPKIIAKVLAGRYKVA